MLSGRVDIIFWAAKQPSQVQPGSMAGHRASLDSVPTWPQDILSLGLFSQLNLGTDLTYKWLVEIEKFLLKKECVARQEGHHWGSLGEIKVPDDIWTFVWPLKLLQLGIWSWYFPGLFGPCFRPGPSAAFARPRGLWDSAWVCLSAVLIGPGVAHQVGSP